MQVTNKFEEWMLRLSRGIFYQRLLGNKGDYVMEEEWDNLIILDACRYDVFKEHNDIPGKLESRISRGGCTNEFLKENFTREKYDDLVYVTTNPLVNYHLKGKFHKIVSVWDTNWNEEYGTVMPNDVVQRALETSAKYPGKRMIVHFVQPHYPFIGPWARENLPTHEGMKSIHLFGKKGKTDHGVQLVWNMLKNGEVTKEQLWKAYVENLLMVLLPTKRLIGKLRGRTVISSDHGNLFGKWLLPFPIRGYGHPCRIYKKELVKVPWLVVDENINRYKK